MLCPPPYDKDCTVENMFTGLPLCDVEDNWLTGLRFKFSCTSVGSSEDQYSFKKYRRFLPDQLYANQPETIRSSEPCKGCGGFGMWEGVDNSGTNSGNTRSTFE